MASKSSAIEIGTSGLVDPPVDAPIVSVAGRTADVAVTLFDGEDFGPLPTAFVALTVNVYAVPLVKPVTVIGLDVPIAVRPR